MKKIVKKAQVGTKIDKTAVRKSNAVKDMKNDNKARVMENKNVASYHKNQADKAYQASRSFLLKGKNEMYDFANKQGRKSDSLANVATKKAREAAKNPKFPIKKVGGTIKKKK